MLGAEIHNQITISQSGFWWSILAVSLYGAFHSLLASLPLKELVEKRLGKTPRRFYRLAFNIIATVTFIPVLWLVSFLPDAQCYTIPFPWLVLTMIIQGLAAAGILVGAYQTGLGIFLGTAQITNPDEKCDYCDPLVAGGFYRWVRHPLYSFGLLVIWLSPVMTWNILALNSGLTIYIIIGALFEEQKLLQVFGESYASYRKTTPMLVPGLKQNPKNT